MKKQKDKCLATIKINKEQYSIRATFHSLERMEQRKIDEYVITGNILALGEETLKELQRTQEEAIIIDETTNSSVVIGFKKNTIKVITVINKSNVFVKSNTRIERI